MLNVYYFRATPPLGATEPLLSEMNDAFETVVLNKVKAIQNIWVYHTSREWKNLTNGVDLFVDGTVVRGDTDSALTAALPSFVSMGFILRRESLVTRNGYKRICGLNDNDVTGNEYVGSMTPIHALEEGLASDLMYGLATIAEPIIVKRPITPPVEEYLYSSIGSASFRGVGTQNTRKAGRGV